MSQTDDVVLNFGEEEFDRERNLKWENIFRGLKNKYSKLKK